MRITPQLFEAFLKCQTKCWLRASGEQATGNTYAEWVQTQGESYRAAQVKRLLSEMPQNECATFLSAEKMKTGKWRLATEITAKAQKPDEAAGARRKEPHSEEIRGFATSSANEPKDNPQPKFIIESNLHAVERVPSEGPGKAAQFIPIRFIFTNKLGKDEKLLLAFDAYTLAKSLRREIGLGKIIHGDNRAMLKVKTSTLTGKVRKNIETIAVLLSNSEPPDLVLNRHCAECEFQARCRKIAVEKDDLSLLARMNEKERKKFRNKGIFTVTQLSYTFRPRRRPKKLRDKREKYHHSLKALAIREKKIHIVGRPEFNIEGTPVYLDVEGLPDRDFYYLIGVRIGNGEAAVQHSLWASTVADEGKIWREFLTILEAVEKPILIHYGSYETIFSKQMSARHGNPQAESIAEKTIASSRNLVSVIFAEIYFPTFSNGLKEIAIYLGFNWSLDSPSGVQTIAWREMWSNSAEPTEKQKLISYNTEDCEALEKVTQVLLDLNHPRSDTQGKCYDIVDATTLKREHPYGFKRNTFFFSELDVINKAAYWDYQREKVYVKSNQRLRQVLEAPVHPVKTLPLNKHLQCSPPAECQLCGSTSIQKHQPVQKTVYDLKFTATGVKRWIVCYHFHRYICRSCGRSFNFHEQNWSSSKYGSSLLAYSVYQNIELRLPQETIIKSLNKLFSFRLPLGAASHFKTTAAQTYATTYQSLLEKLQRGELLHADETKVSVGGSDGFVWVFTNLEEVAYIYTESRESDWVQIFLKDFRGVLISDFYAGYDAIECPKQRCLVHLLRDLNDDLYKHPYDEDLKRIGKAFADLVRPMIETVDRYGLKARHLKKHLSFVSRFYQEISCVKFGSEVSRKCKERFEKNREELFTFLRYDNVPWNNNNAEHAIKAFAMLRHIINGVTSEKGLRDYLVLLSVCQTCKYMGVDFLDFLRSGEKDIHAFAERRRRRRDTEAKKQAPSPRASA